MTDPLIGATTALFAVTLSVALTEPVDVAWSTKDGTAKAGIDYEAASGVVTFLPGETEKQIQVTVYGQDVGVTQPKNFYIKLTPPTNAVLGTSLIECIITVEDDEGTPITSIVVAQGKRGFKGDPGLSAYEQAVLMGYEGTVEEWMESTADAAQAAERAQEALVEVEAAAAKAEAAAAAAAFAGRIYPTPAAGVDPVTGVPNGAYYNVRSPSNDTYIDEYQNVNGVATPSGKSYPTADAPVPSTRVTDGTETQEQINDKSVRVLKSVVDLLSYTARVEGQAVFVKESDSFYEYDSTNTSPISLNGWVLQHSGIISTRQLNIQNGADISELLSYADSNKLVIELPLGYQFTSTVFKQSVIVGEGSIKYTYDYVLNDNTEHVAPKTASPYPQRAEKNYGWYDSVQARGNFEHGAGRGLIVNDYGARPQICGFRTKQQQKNYPSVDIAGQYTHVMAPKVQTLTNCTFTANSVTSASITSALDIKVGDFINTEGDPAIGKPWRSEVTAIDYATNTLSVTWWLHESGDGEGIPPNGLSCYTPYVNGLWGENTNVFIRADDKVTTIIGYELGVATEKPRDKFTQINGYYVVNLTSNIARAQTAYNVGGKWDQALLVDDCTAVIVTIGLSKYAVDYTANTDLDSAAVIMRNPLANGGNLSRSVAGLDVLYNVDFAGVQSALKLSYSIHSANISYNGLQPSLCIGANAGVAHTTTISTVRMFAGHILEFKQLEAVNWTIIAGGNTFTLNASGANDYLKLMYDGNFFIKLFMGKSN